MKNPITKTIFFLFLINFNIFAGQNFTSFPSLNIPAGGRCESLGTAMTAMCDDPSFMDYNPAVSSILKETQAAVFHNSQISGGSMETITGTTRFNNFGTGFQLKTFFSPLSRYNLSGTKNSSSYYSETSLAINTSYNFFSGYDFKGLAAGISLRSTWRNMPDYTASADSSALAFTADFGLLMRFNFFKEFTSDMPNLSVGLAANNIGFFLTGFKSGLKTETSLPSKISIGLSYRPIKKLLVNLEFRQPVNLKNILLSESFAVAAGLEFSFTDFFDVEGGILFQDGKTKLSTGTQFSFRKIQMSLSYACTLDSTTQEHSVSLAAKINLGDKGRAQNDEQVKKLYAEGIELYAKGEKENMLKAIEKWEEAKKLSASTGIKFDPAIKAIKTAKELISLHQQIISVEKQD